MAYDHRQLRRDLDPTRPSRPHLRLAGAGWGESGWRFLYSCVLAFEGSGQELGAFFSSLGPALPCPDCRDHYKEFLSENGPPGTPFEAVVWLGKLEARVAATKGTTVRSRLGDIRRVRATVGPVGPGLAKAPDPRNGGTTNKKGRRRGPCPNCHKPRAELGATMRSMGLGGRRANTLGIGHGLGIAPR